MARTFDRSVLLGLVLLTTLLVLNAALAYFNTRQLREDAGWVTHTHEVLDLTADVLLALVDAETGERGFLLTGRDEYLQPYTAALPRLGERLAQLKDKTRYNPRQQARLAKLEELAAVRLALLKQRIDLRRQREKDPGALAAARTGREQMDALRALVAEMEQEEHDLLRDREGRSRRAYEVAVTTGLFTAALGLVTVGAFVGLLRRSLRARQQAAAAVNEQREWLRVTLASIGDAVIVTDRGGRVTFLNPVAEALTAWHHDDALRQPLEAVFQIINEQNRQPVESPVARVLREGTLVGLGNHTNLIARDGTERPIDDSAAPIRDSQGQVGGVVLVFRDVSERRRAVAALLRSERELADFFENATIGLHWVGPDGTILRANRAELDLLGYAPEEYVGRPIAEFHADPDVIHDILRRLRTGQQLCDCPARMKCKDGSLKDVLIDASVLWQDGRFVHTRCFTRDVTDRKRAEQDLRFLADASATLAALVDFESTLQKVARLAVPTFADWCTVDMLDEAGTLRRVAVAHVDPAQVDRARELHCRHPPDRGAPLGVWHVLRTGTSEMVPDISDDLLVATVKDGALLRILRELGLKSYLGVPLGVRDKVLGVITFIAAESGRRYGPADLAVAEDLAHRAAVAIENARLYQAVREADRRKDQFLAILAHELRNPLAPIRNCLEILKQAGANVAIVAQAREMAERQVHSLTRMVDDLLDVSRIMRGKIELRRERVDLARVVARAVETAQPVLAAEGHDLAIDLPEQRIWINADVVRLAQVVANLLSNAAKYTEKGGRIKLTAGREGGEAVVRVRDTGIGISPEMLDRIFDLFMQVDAIGSRSQGGLGIGLTVVRSLVEMHGGMVAAQSAGLGHGSEFVVRLPLAPADEPQGGPASRAEAAPAEQPVARKILVVDDNMDAADSLAVLLQLAGQQVQVAYDGATALARASADPPALAFLDLGMPKMDGYELARAFRAHPALQDTVLVAVTGWGQPEDRQRTTQAGFDHHLVKPVEPAALDRLLAEQSENASRSRSDGGT
jgi:PAS domain S-box-containing protein